ncbi:immunoglobulin superfamily member 10 [Betta splendens]|uniref:immunoglobulin superfamily member 10 n=1 Tax=Betta splendens TaxID=158456 RepID=UPI0010F8B71F|nr:immunoglobulin superfamily member 10 [Betta splendens]
MGLRGACVLGSLLVLMSLPAVSSGPCPRSCSCPQPTELHCTFRSLPSIPTTVSRHVERMNLGFNSINAITDRSLGGLRKLELLMVHGNNIHSLPDGAFKDLISLQMLKISYNKVKEINRNTFLGLWSLARLHLDHNRLEFIHPDAFQGLTSLRLLQLEGNRLQQLHPATFTTFTLMGFFHTSTLRHLYLSDNGLTSLPSGMLTAMPQLENLYLHGNPWTCDCNMRWLHDWDKTAPGVLKCKKDRALPGGQLCPMCSSPRHLHNKELQALEKLMCSSPVISSSPDRTLKPEDDESEVMATEEFREPFGKISLGLSDEHGNQVDLQCSLGEPRDTRTSWEQVSQDQLVSNLSLSVDLSCPVDREKYEQLWKLIAYYSSVPAHLKRGIMLNKDPHPTYVYTQDSDKDALYYTGVRAHITAQPTWLMQPPADLQLNRLQSTAKMVKLILSTDFTETLEAELVRRQNRAWVMIQSVNTTRQALSAVLGSPSQMSCDVHSSGQAVVQWRLPDGSKVEAPYSSTDNKVSVSSDGRLVIKSVSHRDAGTYYCIAKVHGDLAVLPFHLTVQESSSPSPGEGTSIKPIEKVSGSPVYLPCTASGSPDAEINWILPSSKIVSFQANSSRAVVYSNGTLHIPHAQVPDSGYYKCIAMNQHGVDTLAAKLTVIRNKGLIRPLRRFAAGPQSASGVNTKIKVPTQELEEASGDNGAAQEGAPINSLDPWKKRMIGGAPAGRRGVHPLARNAWRRKPTGPHVEDRKILGTRRRVNMSKSKINPEKWADILAKIRDRNAPNAATPLPVPQPTTESRLTQQATQSQETVEGSSDGVTVPETEGQDYLTTQHAPVSPTQINTHSTQGEDAHDESTSFIAYDMSETTSNSPHAHISHTTVETQTHTAQNTNLEQHISNGAFSLPQSTSAPLHAVTVWQANTNSASSSSSSSTASFLQENRGENTDVKGVETADGPEASERGENGEKLSAASSNQRTSNAGQSIPSFSPNESEAIKDGDGKFNGEVATSKPQTEPKDTALDYSPPRPFLTTALPATSRAVADAKTRRPEGQSRNSRRRNGGRRNRPNRKKQKLRKTTPAGAPLATLRTTAPAPLNIGALEDTTANFNTAVPFSSGQAVSSGRLSHKESTVSRHDSGAATKPSPTPDFPLSSVLPSAKPLLRSTSAAAAAFPAAAPGLGHGNTSSQTASGSPDTVAPTARHPPVKAVEETQSGSVTGDISPVPQSEFSSGGFHTAAEVQTDVEVSPSEHPHTPTGERRLAPTPSASAPALIRQEYTSADLITSVVSEAEPAVSKKPSMTEQYYSSSQTTSSSAASETTAEGGTTKNLIATSSTKPSYTILVLRTTTEEAPSFTVSHSPDQQLSTIITTAEPRRTTQSPQREQTSPAVQLSSVRTIKQPATPAPTITAIQTNGFREEVLMTTQDVSRTHQLPGRGSVTRGKPRIRKSNFQNFTVKAETDAQLPCKAEGQPMPFLSWTKVATGASIAQNTRVQRFEVHPNGTFIIRNAQPIDEGQYLCMVQNQFGSDRMLVNLVVLSQPPRVLQTQTRDVTVNLGDKVDLECKVEGHPTPRVTWVLPNYSHMTASPFGVSAQRRVTAFLNGTLRISHATFTDRGTYKCIGRSVAGVDSASVHLSVAALPPVIQQPRHENISVPETGTAYISCSATGTPRPAIRWITPDGTQLAASQFATGRNFIVFPNGTLYIRGVGPGNAGKYECAASNAVASSRRTVILSIKRELSTSKARITLSSSERTDVTYGGKLLLNCMATGAPHPQIIWRTPSKKLVDAQYSFDSRIKVFHNGTLTIHSVTDKDSGDYLCVARNKMGDDYVVLRANVLTGPAKIEHKQHRSRQEVVYGGDLKVDCVASGHPNPEISWALPDGTMVDLKQRGGASGGRTRRYVVFDNGTLYFNDVGLPEEGDYTCYAENQLGKDEMKVRVKVKAASSPPQIQNKDPKILKVFYGETVKLRCSAKGEPTPLTTWISPTNRVVSSASDKYQVLGDGTLVVQKVQRFDGGNYTCIAKNNAGQDQTVIRLEVLLTPPVINGLRGTANTIKISAAQDQQALVDCVAKGTPTPRIMWVLPGNVILPAPYYSNRMTVHPNGTLEIRSPKRTDSGQMVCIARNEGGEVRLVVNLDVKDVRRPHITDPKADSLSLTVGKAMTLNCSLEDLRLSHVTWVLPNGTPLLRGARSSKFFHRPDGSLIITNPSVGESGIYRCRGQHSGRLVEQSINLSPGRKPEISNRYNSPVSVMNGDTLLLHCMTSGEPLRLTWTLPSGAVLNKAQRAGRYSVHTNGTLSVQQASVYDRGTYNCRAANEYGSSLHSVSVAVVTYPPRITSAPPSVTYAKRGVAIQLNCVATGVPKVELAWETPDKTRLAVSAQPRIFGNKYLHPQGSLIIQNPTQRDAGVYRCTARNAVGIDSKTTFLNVF